MATRIPTNVQNAANDAVVTLADAGAAAATLEIRTGAQPATANDVATGTLLATITLADPAWGASASGSAALAGAPRSAAAVAAGTAGWFRVKDSNGVTVFDGAITATAGGGEIELDNTNIAVGQTISISSLSFATPATE